MIRIPFEYIVRSFEQRIMKICSGFLVPTQPRHGEVLFKCFKCSFWCFVCLWTPRVSIIYKSVPPWKRGRCKQFSAFLIFSVFTFASYSQFIPRDAFVLRGLSKLSRRFDVSWTIRCFGNVTKFVSQSLFHTISTMESMLDDRGSFSWPLGNRSGKQKFFVTSKWLVKQDFIR